MAGWGRMARLLWMQPCARDTGALRSFSSRKEQGTPGLECLAGNCGVLFLDDARPPPTDPLGDASPGTSSRRSACPIAWRGRATSRKGY
eukprot:5456970-Pyramimonas_sp.AAC.1